MLRGIKSTAHKAEDGIRGLFRKKNNSHNDVDKQSGSTSKDSCPGGNSFNADTLVLIADGRYRKIKDLKPGDKVMAKDPKSDKLKANPVTALIRHLKAEEWKTLEFNDGSTVKATSNHPFWEPEKQEWAEAGVLIGQQDETITEKHLGIYCGHDKHMIAYMYEAF